MTRINPYDEDWPEGAKANNFRCTSAEMKELCELAQSHGGAMYPHVMRWIVNRPDSSNIKWATSKQLEEAMKWEGYFPVDDYRRKMSKQTAHAIIHDLWMQIRPNPTDGEKFIDTLLPTSMSNRNILFLKLNTYKFYLEALIGLDGIEAHDIPIPNYFSHEPGQRRKLNLMQEVEAVDWWLNWEKYPYDYGKKPTRDQVLARIKAEFGKEVKMSTFREMVKRHKEVLTT